MTTAADSFAEVLRDYAETLTAKYQSTFAGHPEDQLKGPLEAVLRKLGSLLGVSVVTKTESPVEDVGRPDVGVAVDGLLTGHIELKAPGKRALASSYKGSDRAQWQRFQALPNLVYTDGNDFTLYREGELVGRVTFKGDVTVDGRETIGPSDARDLFELFAKFLDWQPITPRRPKALAEALAPLSHILRDEVLAAVQNETSGLSILARDWRHYLFPDADDAQFADAYAQTLTYSLLLARIGGAEELTTPEAARVLDAGHSLLAQSLRVLSDPRVEKEIGFAVGLLRRVIGAVNPAVLESGNSDPWLYFYEDFLAAYDPALRNNRGVYYTPVQVVQAQVRLVSQLLQEKFGKPLGFADDDVVVLDPAVGTGTYPLAAFEHGAQLVADRFGDGAVGGRATEMAKNFHAFELLVGPYAVAHLRLTQRLQDAGATLPRDGVHVYLTDTLESPHAAPPGQQTFFHKELAEEHKRAQAVKASKRVLVCIGNPPYDRQVIDSDAVGEERKGGWVRFGDGPGDRPILEDFLEPARQAGQGVHLKNLYNDYVYFWRWALWKVFEQPDGPGIVSFITASSYLRGPGFVGMRQLMRSIFDELWIIDLEGDNLGARKTENVFDIQNPVAIAVGVRYGDPKPDTPATVRYTKLLGTREEKFAALDRVHDFSDLDWQECFSEWPEPFLPKGKGDYYSWPRLTDLFPWQHSGSQFKRTWPIAETREVLTRRWRALLDSSDRAEAFHETRDRKIAKTYPHLFGGEKAPSIAQTKLSDGVPDIRRYGFRSFDRQWAIADSRVGDFLRPSLWRTHSDRQVYMTSFLTNVLGLGPAATVTAEVPDLHHFRRSFGGKEVIPLWRDPGATSPNVTLGLLDEISTALGQAVTPEDLFAYAYGVLAGPAYVENFSEELTLPGPRVPITTDADLFTRVVALGRRLLWLHTYGTRFVPDGKTPGAVPRGRARCVKGVPADPDRYPEAFDYDPDTATLYVGDGVFAPVPQEVWDFSVSGFEVVKSWLSYRMKDGAGLTSSPLDEIRPTQWTAQLTEELLEVLWVLEATVDALTEHRDLLAEVVASDVLSAEKLPQPSAEERTAPTREEGAASVQAPLFD